MSRFHPETAPCTACGEKIEVDVVASIHADRRPDLRAAVLDDSLQREQCPKCSAALRLEPELTYVDASHGLWVLVKPARLVAEWTDLEDTARTTFARAYGDEAPPDARTAGARLKPRIAFGWAALREKALCAEHGVDDVALELAKLAILRTSSEPPLGDDTELRLVKADAANLTLEWRVAGSDERLEALEVPRSLLKEVAGDAGWAPLRAELNEGPFVDIDRTLVATAD
jgi:hypothetical protein